MTIYRWEGACPTSMGLPFDNFPLFTFGAPGFARIYPDDKVFFVLAQPLAIKESLSMHRLQQTEMIVSLAEHEIYSHVCKVWPNFAVAA